jgi:hypothetical protein
MMARKFDEVAIHGMDRTYQAWKHKAQIAREQACTDFGAGLKPKFQESLWKELKNNLLTYFLGNCAYCEATITSASYGEVEHYRPKKRVEECKPHPGYYWLAYDPQNLLPSCQLCNGARAKLNHFPTENNLYCLDHTDNCREIPLLLNPYFDFPFDHLNYLFNEKAGEATGYIEGTTPKGVASIITYNLNRDDLLGDRSKSQNEAIQLYATAQFRGAGPEFIRQLSKGGRPFIVAKIAAIFKWVDWYKKQMDLETQLLAKVLG